MIIDPDREGCSIWTIRGFQRLKGTVEECCERIIKHVIISYTDPDGSKEESQWCLIHLDVNGFGMVYADYFNHRNIKFMVIKPTKIV